MQIITEGHTAEILADGFLMDKLIHLLIGLNWYVSRQHTQSLCQTDDASLRLLLAEKSLTTCRSVCSCEQATRNGVI